MNRLMVFWVVLCFFVASCTGPPMVGRVEPPVAGKAGKVKIDVPKALRLLDLTTTAPLNDNIANATEIPALTYQTTQSVVGATSEPNEPNGFALGPGGGGTVWFKYTATESKQLLAHTFNSNYDTGLTVWQGPPSCIFSFPSCDTLVGSDDDAVGLTSRVRFNAVAGTTYYFQVVTVSFPDTLVFTLEPAPPPLVTSLAIDRYAQLTKETDPITGKPRDVVTVSGSFVSSEDALHSLQIDASQLGGPPIITGLGTKLFSSQGGVSISLSIPITPWPTGEVVSRIVV